MTTTDDCVLVQSRYFDAEALRWGYEVVCEVSDHKDQKCPGEWAQLVHEQPGPYVTKGEGQCA